MSHSVPERARMGPTARLRLNRGLCPLQSRIWQHSSLDGDHREHEHRNLTRIRPYKP
jgi:hypothetical protein